nr:hypothetical protein [uncultured Draconibacterium sp.]
MKDKHKYKHSKKIKPKTKYSWIKRPAYSWVGFFTRNIIVGVFFYLLFLNIYNHSSGYKWLNKTFVRSNWKFIHEHSDWDIDQKRQVKFGFIAKYLNFIVENTPDTAIILMPSDSVVQSIDARLKLKYLTSKAYVNYFLYPRKPVYYKCSEDSAFIQSVTHVAIVNGSGYENLNFQVKNHQKFTVLPINLEQKK